MGHAIKKKREATSAKIYKLEKKEVAVEPVQEGFSLEELLKIYPGLTLETASLLSHAHSLSKKHAA